jgi:HK97 family phage major capsid protein
VTATLSLRELGEQIGAKRKKVGEIFDSNKVDGEYKLADEQVSEVRQLNAELKDLGAQYEELKEIEDIRRGTAEAEERDEREGRTGRKSGGGREIVPNGDGSLHEGRVRTLKGLLESHPGFLAFQAKRTRDFSFELTDVELKTLITLGDIAPQSQRSPDIVPSAQAFRDISDLFAQGTITGNTYEYYEETTFTNAAAETAEAGLKPESALSWTLRTDTMRKIATWVPATEESLEDTPALLSTIQNRLRYMVVRRRAGQLLNGDGTAPNLSGITDRSGVQTTAKGASPTFDAILHGMVLVEVVGDAMPTGIVVHPYDWEDLVKTRTADGLYILGNPGDPEIAQRLWGLDLRVTPQQTENTAIVGAFKPYAEIFRKPGAGITIKVSTEHDTFFVYNKVAILAEERLLLAIYRPAAFCTVTGI